MSGPYQFPERRPRVVRRLTTALAVGLAAVLAASLTGQVPALAARKPAYQKLKPQMDRSVAGSDAVAQKRGGRVAHRVAGQRVGPGRGRPGAPAGTAAARPGRR